MSLNTGNAAFARDGANLTSTTAMTLGTPTQLQLGHYGTIEQLNGWIKSFKYYPLNASILGQITSLWKTEYLLRLSRRL